MRNLGLFFFFLLPLSTNAACYWDGVFYKQGDKVVVSDVNSSQRVTLVCKKGGRAFGVKGQDIQHVLEWQVQQSKAASNAIERPF